RPPEEAAAPDRSAPRRRRHQRAADALPAALRLDEEIDHVGAALAGLRVVGRMEERVADDPIAQSRDVALEPGVRPQQLAPVALVGEGRRRVALVARQFAQQANDVTGMFLPAGENLDRPRAGHDAATMA